LVLRERAY